MLDERRSVAQIADALNTSVRSTYRMIREHGLRAPADLLLPEAELRQALAQGRTVAEICSDFGGLSATTVYSRIKKLGIKSPRKISMQHVPDGRDLAKAVQRGQSVAELAAAYEVTEPTIRSRIKSAGWRFQRNGLVKRDDLTFEQKAWLVRDPVVPIPKGFQKP